MNQRLAKRITSISPSLTLAISAKAKAMKAAGEPVISFSVGEPDFNTPQNIIDAAKKALDDGHTKYTPSSGLLPLRKAICEKFEKDNGLSYEPSQIIVSDGAKHSIFNACYAIVDEGDEVIIPAPYWLTYPEVVKVCGGVPVYVFGKKENKFKITAEELEKAITPKTKMLIFNSPSNPTGAVYTEEEVRAFDTRIQKVANKPIDYTMEYKFDGTFPLCPRHTEAKHHQNVGVWSRERFTAGHCKETGGSCRKN